MVGLKQACMKEGLLGELGEVFYCTALYFDSVVHLLDWFLYRFY